MCASVLRSGIGSKSRVIRQKCVRVWENCGGISGSVVKTVGIYGRKMAIYPHTFILGAYSPTLLGSRCSIPPQFSVYRLLVPCVDVSRAGNWVLPGVIR